MEIAVLGGGHGCYAAAADLSMRGHSVRLWRRDAEALAPLLAAGTISTKDFSGEHEVPVSLATADLAQAVDGASLIVAPLPATTHESLAPRLAPLLRDGQVVFLPPGTFGGFIFARAKHSAGNHADVSFAETGTLPYLARKHGPRRVVISGFGKHLPTGVYPRRNATHALAVIREAYPAVEDCGDLLSGALMNAGPIIHPPLIVMNAGPLEHFERWDIHKEGTQPAIRRVTDALDAERIAVREALGYGTPHFPLKDHYAKEGPEWMYGRGAHDKLTDSGDWREHIVLTEHRYMLEDTRLGLSFIASVGRWAGVATPLCDAFLAIGAAVTGRDFHAEGRTLEKLGLQHLTREGMHGLLAEGLEP
ncbi:MAG: NAD/NADP octopine/nopaline dehydrogenase family protein [Gammaproteobacteria bacterium]